jgi:hypothetical protein
MDGSKTAKCVQSRVLTVAHISATLYRKRKLTDKTIPNAILQNPDFAADSGMYQDLLQMERKLDWTMTRKRVEVQDALSRNPTVRVAPQSTCLHGD